ncbi:hypothetical protein, partial [Arthrobacter sp. CAN_A2]|uniref:hypothetical protein n=1 Tax=Arthrobacter sp. CAN_A2 TaxID=2787718 RepID=UPI002FEF01C6
PANSTNQKTIGINKLGTLLSSQTTGTTGTKHNHNSHILAPEQIFKPTRTHSITANPLRSGRLSHQHWNHRAEKPYEDTGRSRFRHALYAIEPLRPVGGLVALTGATP